MSTETLTPHHNRALDVYGIFYVGRPKQVTARTIRNALLALGTEKALAAVARIDHLCNNGERYSNQCFDELSSAADVLPAGWLDR